MLVGHNNPVPHQLNTVNTNCRYEKKIASSLTSCEDALKGVWKILYKLLVGGFNLPL